MAVSAIPKGYHSVTPYLMIGGAAKLIDFLKQAFDATETERFSGPNGSIMHAEVKIGDSVVMMGEPREESQRMPGSIHLYVKDTDQCYRRALQAGASSMMEPADQFYGDRSAGVKDPTGNVWWIATHIEDVPPEEMKRRMEAMLKQKVH